MAALRTGVVGVAGLAAKLGRLSVSLSSQVTRPFQHTSLVTASTHFRLTPWCASLHTSSTQQGLKEFFDDEKNWGEMEVKVGRAWKIEELRIKSNEDLHKLWFVLLKEKNMLLTMEHACNEEYQVFPNPERIDKVEESMKNLENVVRERNRAYWLLETGEDGEHHGEIGTDSLGRRRFMKYTEHTVPYWSTGRPWRSLDKPSITRFSRLMREQKFLKKRRALRRIRDHVYVLRRYPHMDMDVLQKKYPEVNVRALRHLKRSLGHHSHNLA
ncbi:39S ribosomal protein L47, mitochondrial-like [Portunus trituberculatus]|uniref:39S ribosomal protein L47, mitochondrial-like n=1 Tax=Portunus trituberculatus TaxID=210409 RepID=UPI001E1CBA10|nr:39S ribosomal protein L47, mitochondrial-like [Portunus trituberculatus]